jgi:hypothetical protein
MANQEIHIVHPSTSMALEYQIRADRTIEEVGEVYERELDRMNRNLQDVDNILWWGSMVTPVGTADFRTIVLPIPIPLLYLGSLSAILGNQAFYR